MIGSHLLLDVPTVFSYNLETFLYFQCRETEALNRNENICMALDKFKCDNNLPTEQSLIREKVSRTLIKIERLMRHQVGSMSLQTL